MRYGIRLQSLPRCSGAFEQAARAQNRETGELQSVIRGLNGLWGMDGILSGLRRNMQDMEEEIQITLSMAQAAQRIQQIYTDTERTLTDAADCPFRMDPGRGGCGSPVFPEGGAIPEELLGLLNGWR